MLKLFNFFVDICLLRRAPQDLPASGALFALVVLLSVAVGAVGVSDVIAGLAAFAAAMLDAVIAMVLLRLALMLKNHPGRFLQTATALFGSSIIMGLIALPLQLAIDDKAEVVAPFVSVAYLFLLIWIQVIIGHILRHALDVSMMLGVGLALTYSVLSGVIIQSLFLTPAA